MASRDNVSIAERGMQCSELEGYRLVASVTPLVMMGLLEACCAPGHYLRQHGPSSSPALKPSAVAADQSCTACFFVPLRLKPIQRDGIAQLG